MSVAEIIEEICKMDKQKLKALSDYIDSITYDADNQCTLQPREVDHPKAQKV